jgi:hypothetical protein
MSTILWAREPRYGLVRDVSDGQSVNKCDANVCISI